MNQNTIRQLFIAFFGVLATPFAYSQEMFGVSTSTKSDINGAFLNPTSTVTSPNYLGINLFSIDVFAENNYLYLAKEEYKFRHFFTPNAAFPTHGEDHQTAYDNFTATPKQTFVNTRVTGPSFFLCNGKMAGGFFSGFRTTVSVSNLPADLAKFMYDGLKYEALHDSVFNHTEPSSTVALSFAEFGLNLAYVFYQKHTNQWSVGANLKYLKGLGASYMEIEKLNYEIKSADTLNINHLDAKTGFSLPLDYQNNEYQSNPLFRGSGIALDFGIAYESKQTHQKTWRKSPYCRSEYVLPKWRVGFSILDLGWVKFNKNAMLLVSDNVSTTWLNVNSMKFDNVNQAIAEISNQFYGNPTELVQGNEILVGLPTALSIQGEYNLMNHFYIGGTIIAPVKVFKPSLARPWAIAAIPRYVTEDLEFSVPISYYDGYKFHVGAAAQYRGFFIGTDNLAGFFSFTNFTGISFYLGLKLCFKKGSCKTKPVDCLSREYEKYRKTKKSAHLKSLKS